jgi:hypothetical protein
MSLAQQVRKRFQGVPEGGVIASRELHRLSTESQSVDKAASRLYKTEGLRKLRNGLYYKPYNSRYFGELPPGENDILQAVQKQYDARVSPSGALAAYELGLVPSLPDVITYETDKRIGSIQLDNHTISFNKVIETKLKAVEPSLLALLKAIEFISVECDELTPLQQKRIGRLLGGYAIEQVVKAIDLWPRWFQEKIKPQLQALAKPYISGLSALNIPHEGKQADWHQMGMLHSGKFQIVGKNYDGAPGIGEEELFECGAFLRKFDVDVGTTLCATPSRAIKDILYASIIMKTRYPSFFMLDHYMLDLPKPVILAVIEGLEALANGEQKKLLNEWARDNELD